MAKGLNKCQGIGKLGADPDVKFTNTGMAVSQMRVAINERVKKGDQWSDHTEWLRVTCFGKTAENVGQYLAKGSSLYFEGKLRTREYTDKQGVKRWSTEVLADNVIFLGGGGVRGGDRPAPTPPADDDAGFMDDDSLPF